MLNSLISHLSGINPYLAVFLLGILPISEVRIAIIYGSIMHLNPVFLLILGIAANIAEIPIIFWLFSRAKIFKMVYGVLGKRVSKKIASSKGKFEKYGVLALLLFVASQVPGTGGFTGALVCEILNLNRKKAFAVISFGIAINAIVMFAIIEGIAGINAALFTS